MTGSGRHRLPVTEYISHGAGSYSTGNTVSGMVTALYRDRRELHLWGAQHHVDSWNHHLVHPKLT